MVASSLADAEAGLSVANPIIEWIDVATVGFSGSDRVHLRVEYHAHAWDDDPQTRGDPEIVRFYCAALARGTWRIAEIVSY